MEIFHHLGRVQTCAFFVVLPEGGWQTPVVASQKLCWFLREQYQETNAVNHKNVLHVNKRLKWKVIMFRIWQTVVGNACSNKILIEDTLYGICLCK